MNSVKLQDEKSRYKNHLHFNTNELTERVINKAVSFKIRVKTIEN